MPHPASRTYILMAQPQPQYQALRQFFGISAFSNAPLDHSSHLMDMMMRSTGTLQTISPTADVMSPPKVKASMDPLHAG